eukprot:3391383-Lingulodinium_polyedra.AAC.1
MAPPTHQEVVTLPLSGKEMGAYWYAHARLACSTLSALTWGASCPAAGKWWTYLSRVLEKTA